MVIAAPNVSVNSICFGDTIHRMDTSRIDLNLLVSLEVLLAERNVTKAASRLGLSQPALSAQLNRLRDLFEDPLLVPAHL
jgi:DNA-binding transcriptional ArsR family regulator